MKQVLRETRELAIQLDETLSKIENYFREERFNSEKEARISIRVITVRRKLLELLGDLKETIQ